MKNIFLTLLLGLALALGGCPSDDNDTPDDTQGNATEQSAPDSTALDDNATVPPDSDATGETPGEAVPDALPPDATSSDLPAPEATPAAPEVAPDAPAVPADAQEDANQTAAPDESLPQVFRGEALNATQGANATADAETTLVVTAIVETEPEPVSGIALPDLVPEETAKGRNFPPTPQVAKPGEEVAAEFGVSVPQPQPAQETPAPEFGVEAPSPPPATPVAEKPAEAPPAQESQPEPAAPAVAEKPAETPPPPTPEAKPETTPADIGLDLGAEAPVKTEPAPAPEPRKEPEKPALAQPTEGLPEVTLQEAPKPVEPVKMRDVAVHPLSADTPINPMVDQAVSTFKDFAIYWVDKVSGSYIHNRNNIEVVNEGGKFVARYTDIDKKSLELWIKEKPYDHTPFVGLMRYQEYSYEAVGDTPEQALAGKFDVARRLRITEIFRFADGKWIE
jgi:hypothetical protein